MRRANRLLDRRQALGEPRALFEVRLEVVAVERRTALSSLDSDLIDQSLGAALAAAVPVPGCLLQPLDLHVRIAPAIGGIHEIAKPVAIFAGDAVLELGLEGAQPASDAAKRHAKIVEGIEVVRLRRKPIRGPVSSLESIEGNEPRAAIGGECEGIRFVVHGRRPELAGPPWSLQSASQS